MRYISKHSTVGIILLLTLLACNNKENDKIDVISDRSKLPFTHTTDVTTIISDSGVTRYRINTPQWDDFDRANPPYWEFPAGIHFEKFNEQLKVDAFIHCKYAKYNRSERIWELRGKVKANNLKGELFETSILFWNQVERKFYTDSVITITQVNRIITGKGFESNESMTKYTMRESKITFAVNENETSGTQTTTP